MFQKQTLLSQKELKRRQDQALSNKTMGNVFCTIETIASKETHVEPMFSAYDVVKFGKKKSLPELEAQLYTQIQLFAYSLQFYRNEYQKYDFPEDFPKHMVKEFLTKFLSIKSLNQPIRTLFELFENDLNEGMQDLIEEEKLDEVDETVCKYGKGREIPTTKLSESKFKELDELRKEKLKSTRPTSPSSRNDKLLTAIMPGVRDGVDTMTDNIKRGYEADPEKPYKSKVFEGQKEIKESIKQFKKRGPDYFSII